MMSDVSDKFALALEWVVGSLENFDMDRFVVAAILIGLAVLLRRPLASILTAIIIWLLAALQVKLPGNPRKEIKVELEIFVVTLAVLGALDVMSPGANADGVLQRLLLTFIVLSLYGILYRRANLVISTLIAGGSTKVGVNTNWIERLFRFGVAIMAFATVAEIWGLGISGALTGVGVLGAGIAIAAQDFVGNFVSGLSNVSERRFSPGDWIKVEGSVEGTVVSMDLRSTTVMGFDRVPRFVPNNNLANAVLLNYSRMDHRQIAWTFGIALGATDEQVEAVCADLRQYVEESGEYVTDGKLLCFVVPVGLSDSAIEITIYAFAKTVSYQTYLEVCGRLTLALRAAVVRAGAKLAYPTRTVIFENTGAEDAPVSELAAKESSSFPQQDDKMRSEG